MSHASLKTAIEAAREAMKHPLIVAIAAMSSSPSQALLQAQNRGLSSDEQTRCRLLAKAMRLAKDMGMDALSILPSTTLNSKEYIMDRKNAEIFLNLAQNYLNDYKCASYNEDRIEEVLEIMDALLLMSNFSRQANGEVSLEIVKELLAEKKGEAILLLIGDERPEARSLLIDCIIDPKLNGLFYEPILWEKHLKEEEVLKQKFGPILVLISGNPQPFMGCDSRIEGASELLGYISGHATVGITQDEDSIIEPLFSILATNEAFEKNRREVLSKITRAFLAETWGWPISLEEVECATLEVHAWRYNETSEYQVRMYYPGRDGKEKSFDLPDMHDGNDTHILISDPQNLESRLKELAESFDFTDICDGDDKFLLLAQPSKLAKLMDVRDKR